MQSSSQIATHAEPPDDLRRKLVWLTLFRIIATSLLLVVIAVRILSRPGSRELSSEDSLSFALIGVVYGLTVVHGLVLRLGRVGRAAAWAQILGDVLVATCLIYLTGGVESPFTFTYSVAVVAASILLSERGAVVAACAASASFALLVAAISMGLVQGPSNTPPKSADQVAFALTSNVLSQFLIAALANYLSKQLSRAGGRLTQREADLRAISDLQQQILGCMPSGLITCDRDGTISFVNRAAESMLSLSPRAGDVSNIEQVIPGVLRLAPNTRRSELTVDTPVGRQVLGLTVSELNPGDGSILVVFQNLTDLRRAEEQLRRVDHLAALGKLSAQLAHEIRNPLASMRGAAQMLGDELKGDQASERLAQILVRESDRLSVLLEEFLRFARPPPPNLAVCELRGLVVETIEMLRADPISAGVRVDAQVVSTRAWVDPDHLKQVLLNLLRNAFTAAGPGGAVRVSARSEGAHTIVRVWDSAGSIPPEHINRIFEPFFTTKEGGTGLGLSTAHSIVRALGGDIRVSSSPGEGTEFVVDLQSSEGIRADFGRR